MKQKNSRKNHKKTWKLAPFWPQKRPFNVNFRSSQKLHNSKQLKDYQSPYKNIAAQVLRYNSKNWMKNLELLYLTRRSIHRCQPKQKQNHLKKLRNKQSNKLNKDIIIDKTLKLLPQRQNLIPLNIPISKICSKPHFLRLAHYICKGWKKSFALVGRLTLNFSKIKKNDIIENLMKCFWKLWY